MIVPVDGAMPADDPTNTGMDGKPSNLPEKPITLPESGSVDFVLILREEVGSICASEIFRRSPMIVRLLKFLAEETVAGRGERLKSYTVAVDGLGRPDAFDAATDSYPRVQVTRLRKLLEAHYSEHNPVRGLCVSIPSGSYELRLAPRELAYPALPEQVNIAPPPNPESTPPNPVRPESGSAFGWRYIVPAGLVVLAGLLAAAWWMFARPTAALHDPVPQSPLVIAMQTTADQRAEGTAQAVYAMLLDGLSRSWAARTVTSTAALPKNDTAPVYRIESQITQAAGTEANDRRLFVRLIDNASSTVVWSKEYRLQRPDTDIAVVTDAVLADLGGSYGAIARNEGERLKTSFAPGYACLNQYFRYITTRNHAARARIRQCLEQPSPEPRLEGMRRGTKAMFVFDIPPSHADRAQHIRISTEEARRAVEAYPNDYFAQFALARMSYSQMDCTTGERHTRLAITANPNDPFVTGVLSTLTYFCGVPDTMGLADRTFRFQVNGDTSARIVTLLVTIATNRRDRLKVLADLPIPETGENAAYVRLCNVLLYAALDDRAAARKNWDEYRGLIGRDKSVDDLLGEYIVADLTREHVTAWLRQKGVIDPPKSPSSSAS